MYYDIRRLQDDRNDLQGQIWQLQRDLAREHNERNELERWVGQLQASIANLSTDSTNPPASP